MKKVCIQFIFLIIGIVAIGQSNQEYTFTKNLKKGWNIIGSYGYFSQPVDKALESIWDQVEVIKDMDNSYTKGDPAMLNRLDSLRLGVGYLIKVKNNCTLKYSGCTPDKYVVPIIQDYSFTKSLKTGWNLVGYYGYLSQPVNKALEGIWDKVVSVKDMNKFYQKGQSATLNSLDSLRIGEGYYIRVNNNCTVTLSGCMPSKYTTGTITTNFTETVNSVAFDMIYVKGGSYQRGCDNCAAQDQIYEAPVHNVTLSDFHIGKYEITCGQWKAVMGEDIPWGSTANSPKIGVSWFDANDFVCKLNSMTGKTFRLLTDAEWEFAARGGNAGIAHKYTYSGSNNVDDVAWHTGNSGNQPHTVGTKAPNELGVYDMSGNAWEWVYDWLVAYTSSAKTDPVQITGTGNKTRRGGSYDEPSDFARVSRRAIRSRDGAAGMGFRIAYSNSLPPGMVTPCEAANPAAASCTGNKNRDCRLITQDGEVWATTDGNILIIKENGAAVVTGYPNVSGEWYTLNNRSLNIVSVSGTKTTKTYAYYVFSENEMTMINEDGMPYRLYKKPIAEVTGTIPSVPVIANPTSLTQLIANVEPARMVTDAQLASPDTTVRDMRLVPASGYTWFMDGRCCGGNHKYRFHLKANGDAEFVVMDYDNTLKENVLARGRWFTVGNIALHIMFDGGYYNYLYTVGNRTIAFSEYMPVGPIFSHISFQSYERGDFRIFSRYTYDSNVMRPKGFNGDNPVYPPGVYQTSSGGN